MWQNWVNVVLGLVIAAVPFMGLSSDTLMWSLIVAGLVVAGLSFWSAGVEVSEDSPRLRHTS